MSTCSKPTSCLGTIRLQSTRCRCTSTTSRSGLPLSLRDALGLLALYAAEDSPKYEQAATRWLGRLALESDDLSLDDAQLAAGALHALPRRPDSALSVVTDLSR